MYLDF